uniref:Carbonic anhydrase n=1 Tax=Varanus komodoensis TaxID=61221 RepID=A0A8D2Q995_VARKO
GEREEKAVALSTVALSFAEGKHWCYLSQKCHDPHCQEPRQWDQMYEACSGSGQSPINILTRKVQHDWTLQPLRFREYSTRPDSKWSVENNGHTVQVNLKGSAATIESGGLSGSYKAVQFHFHWGNGDGAKSTSPGSEHSIDGERYAMELHIVHIKEEFPTIEAALANKGIAVLGFFIEVRKGLGFVRIRGNKTEMSALCLDSLIPNIEDLGSFYRYTGSLTTPGCNEDVVWTLFEKPIQLGLDQIQAFWLRLYFGGTKDHWMVDNFRPVQPVGDRIVRKSDANTPSLPAKVLLLLPSAVYLVLCLIQ